MATAYASLSLLVLALVLGPWRVLQGRTPSVNSGLRRDLGIWGGVLGVLHVVIGIQVHFRGKPWLYFMPPPDQRGVIPFRGDLFGFANYTGLVATVVLAGLLALSNDWSLRRLGTIRWKRWQRLNYTGMAMIVLHGVAYQVIENRTAGFVVLLAVLTLPSIAMQITGYRRVRLTREERNQ